MIIQSEPINLDGYLLRLNDYGRALILSDEHFAGLGLKSDVISFIKNKDVQGIEINYTFKFTKTSLEFLKDIDWIRNVHIIKNDLELGGLNTLKELSELNISANNVEPLDFSDLKKLKTISLKWTKQRTSILKLTQITTLIIDGYKGGRDLKEFGSFGSLTHLSLINSAIESLSGVQSLRSLSDFTLAFNSKLQTLEGLGDAPVLASVSLRNVSRLKSIYHLTKCEQLTSIVIENCKAIDDNKCIFELKKLKTLSFISSGFFITIKDIVNLKGLESFYVGDTDIKDGDLAPLLSLKNLKRCFFSDKSKYSHKLQDIRSHFKISN